MAGQMIVQKVKQTISQECLWGAWRREYDSQEECIIDQLEWYQEQEDLITCVTETIMQVAEANPTIIGLIAVCS